MSHTLVLQESYSVGSKSYKQSKQILGDQLISMEEDLPAAKTGTLTVRTDADTGTLTMTGGHGITTGARLDVYWAGGCRRGMTVGTVATNSVPIDGGAGDALPVATTAITAMVPLSKPAAITGNNVIAMVAGADVPVDKQAQVVVADGSSVELGNVVLTADPSGTASWIWQSGSGYTNPLAGDVGTQVFLSHGDSTASRKVRAAILLP